MSAPTGLAWLTRLEEANREVARRLVNAMETVSGVVFLFGPQTELASVSVLNMDDTGETASAAAMAMMIFYTNVAARAVHAGLAPWVERRTQAWRGR